MAKRLRIEGRVQGVGYRASFARKAKALGLAGWVRNREDGSVEAEVDGDAGKVDAIIEWSKHGPPTAKVSRVAVEDVETAASPEITFDVLPTL